MTPIVFSREWAMPGAETFTVPPIWRFVMRYASRSSISVDPFARNSSIATWRNDLNPDTAAPYHMDAEEFLREVVTDKCDMALIDPPYSPRQISECYAKVGLSCGREETQSAALYKRVRRALQEVLTPGAIVLSFGWNSAGMGRSTGATIEEILLVNHGGAHNDTICIAERMP